MTADTLHYDRLRQAGWEWWLAAVLALTSAAFGAYGLWVYEGARGEHPDIWSVGYHTLQLFLLHAPHLEHAVPWQLNVGRWLTAAVVLGAVTRGLFTVFQSECRLFGARCRPGHVVICGLGRLGMQLALEFRRAGQRVVAIEMSGATGQIAAAHDAGVAVITGDACASGMLRRAAVERASKIIAVCDDEQKNVAIAATVGELLARRTRHDKSPARPVGPENSRQQVPLECWLFITDPRLRQMFQQDRLFPHIGDHYRVNVRGLDLFELAARQILRRAPLDYEHIGPTDETGVHMVIVGFGSMGQQLALQAAKIGHYANSRKLRVTVVDQAGGRRSQEFSRRYPKFSDVCDFTTVPLLQDHTAVDAILPALAARHGARELVTVAMCWNSPNERGGLESDFFQGLEHDDPTNLSLALTLTSAHAGRQQVLVFQTRKCGFGALFPMEGRGDAIGPQMHAFGMLEDTCSLDALLHEREDAIAKVLHKSYCDKQIEQGRKPGSRPALFPWEQLHDRFKDSNRRAADHIRVKLRAIGYRVDELGRDQALITFFDDDQVELLARMEHESWCAEWMLQGYSYAPGERDDVKKTQPYLVPWDQLDKGVQEWDRTQVRVIPEALRRANYGIYSQVP